MADRSSYSLVDFVYAAISPVLIMALVGSLVFFLIDICYESAYKSKVEWILFWFVFGSVLVSRISMSGYLKGRAPLYGLLLGAAAFFALLGYVAVPGFSVLISLGLLILVWWCAHKLTWDCTLLDEEPA